jgi:hypothetical protein
VVTVCDEASAEQCPVFPGPCRHLHWPFPDPGAFEGNAPEKLAATRGVRDAIRRQVEAWVANDGSTDLSDAGQNVAGSVQTDSLHEPRQLLT